VAASAAASAQPAPPSDAAVRQQLAGMWMLVKYEVFDENGTTRRGNYDVGRLTYGEREMDAHLLRSGQDAASSDAARSDASRAYLGYFGPYTIDVSKRIVVHHVAGSSRRDWIGTDQVRHYGFSSDGKQLTLSLKSGERITQTLTWERLR
jgi:Lipocalin-like domain